MCLIEVEESGHFVTQESRFVPTFNCRFRIAVVRIGFRISCVLDFAARDTSFRIVSDLQFRTADTRPHFLNFVFWAP